MTGGVWVISEGCREVAEVLACARPLAYGLGDKVLCILAGGEEEEGREVARYGADRTVLLDLPKNTALTEGIVEGTMRLCSAGRPKVVLLPSRRWSKEVAPRIATRLQGSCANDCRKVWVTESGEIRASRVVYGGGATATIAPRSLPFVATISAGAYDPLPQGEEGNIERIEVSPQKARVRLLEARREAGGRNDLAEAQIIIAAGRGLARREDLKLIEELASLLGGVVAGSRPLTEDLSWLPRERQVGLSGAIVKPKLYVAVGISGQVQHIAGMRGSKVVVAINRDRDAPIFEHSDYGIVGDLYEVLPALISAIRRSLRR